MPETPAESARTPDVNQVMRTTIQKLEQKNSELDGNLLVTFGAGEHKALVFPNSIKTEGKIIKHEGKGRPSLVHDVPDFRGPATFVETPDSYRFLVVTEDGFKAMSIEGHIDQITRAIEEQKSSKTQDNELGYIEGRMHLKTPDSSITYPPIDRERKAILSKLALRDATPEEVEEIFRLNKENAERKVSAKAASPSTQATLAAAAKIDQLLK
ncbi:MAG: hypothetical protein Q7R51_02750 [bacterium]|nr:hypothetical protein [bacterium]